MRTIQVELYQFNELSEDAKQKAIEQLGDIDYYDWWSSVYEDAETIGLKITSFDIYHRAIDGDLTEELPTVVKLIFANHGKTTDTYQLAMRYKNKHGEDNEEEFRIALLQEYLSILDEEYNYLTSEEAIIETITVNEYEFAEDGRLA